MAILIISTGGLIYDGITNVIVSYLEVVIKHKLLPPYFREKAVP